MDMPNVRPCRLVKNSIQYCSRQNLVKVRKERENVVMNGRGPVLDVEKPAKIFLADNLVRWRVSHALDLVNDPFSSEQ
jgi:hypothetical protein